MCAERIDSQRAKLVLMAGTEIKLEDFLDRYDDPDRRLGVPCVLADKTHLADAVNRAKDFLTAETCGGSRGR